MRFAIAQKVAREMLAAPTRRSAVRTEQVGKVRRVTVSGNSDDAIAATRAMIRGEL